MASMACQSQCVISGRGMAQRKVTSPKLKPQYRAQIAEQGFVIVHRHVKDFEPEA